MRAAPRAPGGQLGDMGWLSGEPTRGRGRGGRSNHLLMFQAHPGARPGRTAAGSVFDQGDDLLDVSGRRKPRGSGLLNQQKGVRADGAAAMEATSIASAK